MTYSATIEYQSNQEIYEDPDNVKVTVSDKVYQTLRDAAGKLRSIGLDEGLLYHAADYKFFLGGAPLDPDYRLEGCHGKIFSGRSSGTQGSLAFVFPLRYQATEGWAEASWGDFVKDSE